MAEQSTPMTGDSMSGQSAGTMPNQSAPDSMMDQAKEAVGNAANQAAERAQSEMTRGAERAASAVDAVAQSLRTFGRELNNRNEAGIGRMVDRAADRAEQMAKRLNNADPGAMLDGIEDFARREPAMFIGGALALGLLTARFIKSSRRSASRTPSAQPVNRANAMVPVERDVTDRLRHRDDIPGMGPMGQPTL